MPDSTGDTIRGDDWVRRAARDHGVLAAIDPEAYTGSPDLLAEIEGLKRAVRHLMTVMAVDDCCSEAVLGEFHTPIKEEDVDEAELRRVSNHLRAQEHIGDSTPVKEDRT